LASNEGERVDADELKRRTKQFGLRIIKLIEALPSSKAANVMGNQLLRSGTSVGANYRAACRARSKPDLISKASISIEEADESLYWMEMLVEAEIMPKEKIVALMKEADEIVAILTASVKTARHSLNQRGQ
jgi:four helix bundle protein